ncbi:hypothetical protein EAH86_08690 [Pedococcus bigeumensis]|uniref:Uncharacterized protein n=1 Tax=Pedococcus bigeumensis TaxID=433644 RepID=A0A502CVM5_9MICO|nr:hypothetical protein EAH86_08690 [Pedococcus bigeumensis]
MAVVGIPARPTTWTSRKPVGTPPPDSFPSMVRPPGRESVSRAGVIGLYIVPVGIHPATSTTMLSSPAAFEMETAPPSPTMAMTRTGFVSPLARLRLEALGRGAPAGQTVA